MQEKTKTKTLPTATIFMTSSEDYVPLLSHEGDIRMSYLKLPASLVVILLLTMHVKDSAVVRREETSPLNPLWADLGLLAATPTVLRNYQSQSLVTPNAWRGLVPLKSTRADVEQLLGSSKGLLAGNYNYETKTEKVEVMYSEGSCKPSLEGQWNVPVDTVLSITVFPQTKVLVSTLRLDERTFSRAQEAHPENWLYYVSPEKGVMVHAMQINGCEEVMSITYRPTTKDEGLRCPKNAKKADKKVLSKSTTTTSLTQKLQRRSVRHRQRAPARREVRPGCAPQLRDIA